MRMCFTQKSRRRDDGFTLVEMLIVILVISILGALSIQYLVAARAAANEASAIGSMRALNGAQEAYATSCAHGNYAASFARLVQGNFASPDMNLSPKSGYIFNMDPATGNAGVADCDGQATRTRYYASGVPISTLYGSRGFATNQAGTIWQDEAGTAPAEPFATTGTVSPLGTN